MRSLFDPKPELLWLLIVSAAIFIGFAAFEIYGAGARSCPDYKHSCIHNLRQIDGAKEYWALETHQTNGSPAIVEKIDEYIKGGHPKCPEGGTYAYRNVDKPPTCSIKGHSL